MPIIPQSVQQWYNKVPLITKAIITISAAVIVAPALGIVDSSTFVLNWNAIFKKGQVWRLITTFFSNRLSFGSLMGTYYLYCHSIELETDAFQAKKAEYAYYLFVTSIFQLAAASILGLSVMTNGFSMSIAYLWGRHYQGREVSFMLGLRFKALYLPWVILASDFITSGRLSMASLIGIGASRAYCYLKDEYPRQGGRQLVAVPEFWVRFFNRGFSAGGGSAGSGLPNPLNLRLTGNSQWSGSGFRLGTR
ncbi:Der1-like family-domain-containing protein [Phycomyces blakesleeanus]|uniref:Derlin n=2 Tax=Phycomyces blakesleeanus TaxID=4837 RepID=A0A167NMA6_PHYB8|nr:hypothetical protein PHYBLDRAFT_76050 [Phycomyces blakesleeanus NRRL 1555(-)]OAD76264.1 hypothetical protein PHYBLDRAFT_76050 [Phycomyces blakesleeanus NRRL 1555(-)]|eukprot:XP_018294304.1 hypothetical protein PHYBLDRAFT_76050 [Phycomyces blakesleeanus NRRL 1555(-)]